MQQITPFTSQADEEEKKKASANSVQEQSVQQTTPQPIEGVSTALGGSSPSSAPSTTASKDNTSGRYQNLQKYMAAGKNWTDAQGNRGLASSISSNITNEGSQAGQNIKALQDAFNSQSGSNIGDIRNAGVTASTIVKGVMGNPTTPPTYKPLTLKDPPLNLSQLPADEGGQKFGYEPWFENPSLWEYYADLRSKADFDSKIDRFRHRRETPITANTLTDADIKEFEKARDANYTGPRGLGDVTGDITLDRVAGQVGNVASKVGQAQTERGRYSLLRSMFGNGHYSKGQQDLDNLLIQGDKGQMKQLKSLTNQSSQLANQLGMSDQEAQNKGLVYSKEAEGIQNSTRNQLSDAASKIYDDVSSSFGKANSSAREMSDWLSGGQSRPEALKQLDNITALGMTSSNLFGVNPSDYINVVSPEKMASVATPEQILRINALKNLTGDVMLGQAAQKAFQELAGNDALAGTYKAPYSTQELINAVNAGKDKFLSGSADILSSFLRQKEDLNNQINSMQNYKNSALIEAQRSDATTPDPHSSTPLVLQQVANFVGGLFGGGDEDRQTKIDAINKFYDDKINAIKNQISSAESGYNKDYANLLSQYGLTPPEMKTATTVGGGLRRPGAII